MEDLRGLLERLERAGRLRRITVPVDPRFELAGVCTRAHRDPVLRQQVLLFEQVRGHALPVVANLCDTREKVAFALETDSRGLLARGVQALERPIPPVVVDSGPCQEVVMEPPDLRRLPLCTNSELDGGPYITAGLHITANPVTGVRNVGVQRNQYHEPDLLGIWMAPTHMFQHYLLAEAAGRPLPVAIAVGVHPALLVASQMRLAFDEDEMAAAGGLLGAPVPLVRCRTVPLEVPAHAEVVIEGEVLPHVRRREGPFGEFARLYGAARDLPVVRVTAITHRRGALWHNLIAATIPENAVIGAAGREPALFKAVRSAVPTVTAVHMPTSSGANFHAIIALQKRTEGEPQKAAFAAFAHQDLIKHVFVVDDDIDIYDPADVDYALATRFRADRDLYVIPRVRGNPLDPAAEEYAAGRATVTKMIVDATKPLDAPPERYRFAEVPRDVMAQIERDWARYVGPAGSGQ
ncbi:MAG TPA: UbiD family decarboxylase [Chloroflexota bacterium]|nr:UbiD family decarboxylase [Chloroflexota bacterium]HZU07377.1 UbiD family decarboxylase [Chloroflexota bacterium]